MKIEFSNGFLPLSNNTFEQIENSDHFYVATIYSNERFIREKFE
ncbi:hypothetical protein [Bacillus sp. FJAT-49711]|nr:hypothetical protein [Bacillus sp. FJAT-49711]